MLVAPVELRNSRKYKPSGTLIHDSTGYGSGTRLSNPGIDSYYYIKSNTISSS